MTRKTARSGELLWKAADRIRRRVEVELSVKTPSAKVAVLEAVFANPRGVMLKDIARIVGRTAGAVSQIVELLVKEGAVERIPSASDRRAVMVVPTAIGRRKRFAYVELLNAAVDEALAAATPEERRVFVAMLKRITRIDANYCAGCEATNAS